MSISIDWTNKKQILGLLKKFPDIFEQESLFALNYVAEMAVAKTVEFAPVGSGDGGNLQSTIGHEAPWATAGGWVVEWGTPVEHAEVIEYGRSPGSAMPPVEEITAWVWAKRRVLGFDIEEEEDAVPIALNIARRIAARGFASGPVEGLNGGTAWAMFSRAVKELETEFEDAFNDCRNRIEGRINQGAN